MNDGVILFNFLKLRDGMDVLSHHWSLGNNDCTKTNKKYRIAQKSNLPRR